MSLRPSTFEFTTHLGCRVKRVRSFNEDLGRIEEEVVLSTIELHDEKPQRFRRIVGLDFVMGSAD